MGFRLRVGYLLLKARRDARCRLRLGYLLRKARKSPGFRLRALSAAAQSSARLILSRTFLSSRPGASPAPKSKERRTVQAEGDLHCRTEQRSAYVKPSVSSFFYWERFLTAALFLLQVDSFRERITSEVSIPPPPPWGVTEGGQAHLPNALCCDLSPFRKFSSAQGCSQ